MNLRRVLIVALLGLSLVLTGCTSTPPSVAPIPTTAPTKTPKPVEPVTGSREAPLEVGDARLISDRSIWTVGAAQPTTVGEGWAALNLYVGINWELAEQRASAEGVDVHSDGVEPWAALWVSFVAADGRSFDTSAAAPLTDKLTTVGTVYPPLAEVTGSVPVEVPTDAIAGGVWKVQNSAGEAVWIAAD